MICDWVLSPADTIFFGPAEPTEQREQNQACLSFAESRRRKTIVKLQKLQKSIIVLYAGPYIMYTI